MSIQTYVDILHVTLTEKTEYSRACHDCRTTTIKLRLGDMYDHIQYYSHSLVNEHEVCSVDECEHVGFNRPANEIQIKAAVLCPETIIEAPAPCLDAKSEENDEPQNHCPTFPKVDSLTINPNTTEDWLDEIFEFSIVPTPTPTVDIWEAFGLKWEPLPPIPSKLIKETASTLSPPTLPEEMTSAPLLPPSGYPPASITIEVFGPPILLTPSSANNNIDASGLIMASSMGSRRSPFLCRHVHPIRRQ
ncbi:hypothetical protein F5887DRAFT_1080355 [Amanita rubescens]|nr:hypothetical protein F5887DRAFT_1080355 [Amanita rubescens]